MGGLAGHMMHPHDDLELSVNEFFQMIEDCVYGKQQNLTEKLDGFNVHAMMVGNEIRFARSASDLETGGFGYNEIKDRFQSDRVARIYQEAWLWMDVNQFPLPDWDRDHQTYNIEVICGRTNIIPYTGTHCFIHNVYTWQRPKKPQKWVNTYIDSYDGKFSTPKVKYVGLSDPKETLDTINHLKTEIYKFTDQNGTLEEYYFNRFRTIVMLSPKLRKYATTNDESILHYIFNRFFKCGMQLNLRTLRKQAKDTSDLELNTILDAEKQLVKLTKYELDRCILRIGTFLLAGMVGQSVFRADPNILYQQISISHFTEEFVERWNACNNTVYDMEGVVFEHDRKLYKWTGPFAPINQLLGGQR